MKMLSFSTHNLKSKVQRLGKALFEHIPCMVHHYDNQKRYTDCEIIYAMYMFFEQVTISHKRFVTNTTLKDDGDIL